MSCPDATAPIDIGKDNVAGKCELKCEFSFHYNNSSCIATNRGDYISLAYDSSSSPPVTYNSSSYDVSEVRIYSPSLHSFNGTKADGEFIIIHNTSSGSSPLFVCIPVKSSNSGDESGRNLTNIVQTVASNAPAEDEKTTVQISRFNLNAFVPRKPFFSYTASEPYQPCSGGLVEYIVFPSDSAIGIAERVLKGLQTVIKANTYDIKPSPGLFFNKNGPTNGTGSEIYIDCQPVGESEEETIIITDSGSSAASMTVDDLMQNKYFQMFLGCIIFLVIIYVISLIIDAYTPPKGIGVGIGSGIQLVSTGIGFSGF
jgi:carbonic anhydrase